jgi:aspartyl-tRNA(Asn)/glutamyl-tRNA(Gln) amidotransferase subunit C
MQRSDIQHLATLARLDITDEEADGLLGDLSATLAYIDQVTKAEIPEGADTAALVHYNCAREDVVTNASGEYTDVLIAAAPKTQDGYIEVPKVL